MGKQSSRKSHLLTHLSGLLPDVAEQGGLGEGGQKPIDWAPIDTKCIVLKLNLIKEHLSSAILSGCLAGVDVGKELVNLYSQEKVAPDANELIEVDNYNFEISDTSLHLAPQDTQVTYESILQPLREAFQEVMPWEKGKD
ncbi:unnamed protein product [Sphagnum jensenii]|uniref:Uncharacterized protein n=1 Tax=Sphagnum jensenii TaxID=128206 RepID=A0ABP0W0M5_9BRYO